MKFNFFYKFKRKEVPLEFISSYEDGLNKTYGLNIVKDKTPSVHSSTQTKENLHKILTAGAEITNRKIEKDEPDQQNINAVNNNYNCDEDSYDDMIPIKARYNLEQYTDPEYICNLDYLYDLENWTL